MSADPPEDLCRRLNDLEATVNGLTQELVEAHDRIRELESTLHDQRLGDQTMPSQERKTNSDSEPRDESQLEDDIIVA